MVCRGLPALTEPGSRQLGPLLPFLLSSYFQALPQFSETLLSSGHITWVPQDTRWGSPFIFPPIWSPLGLTPGLPETPQFCQLRIGEEPCSVMPLSPLWVGDGHNSCSVKWCLLHWSSSHCVSVQMLGLCHQAGTSHIWPRKLCDLGQVTCRI